MTVQAVVAEYLGTFFFLSIILHAVNDTTVGVVAIAVGLLAAIYFAGNVSGGHFNPAVSTMFLVKGDIDMVTFMAYIMVQVLAGICAYYFIKNKYLLNY